MNTTEHHRGAMTEGSRGLSISDTPGHDASWNRTLKGRQTQPSRRSPLAPLQGARIRATDSGGIVPVLLNLRLPSGNPPRCFDGACSQIQISIYVSARHP